MGAAGLIEIKRRIKSVQSTRKITNAMGLVATSKLRKSRKELAVNKNYVQALEDIFSNLMASMPEDYNSNVLVGNKKSTVNLYVVIGSDSGLCGGYNGNVINNFSELLKNTGSEETKIIAIGGRIIPLLKRYRFEPAYEYVDIKDVPSFKEVALVSDKIISIFKDNIVREVNIVYTHFISPAKQEVKVEKLLPISVTPGTGVEAMIEPSFDKVFQDSLDLYVQGKLRDYLLSAKCSEQSARMAAMDGATKNANDLISNLNIKFNRIRQGMITQEISEIVGGAEAQK